jgi:hypothetical protein
MATMGATDKLTPGHLGGLYNRLGSACPVQETQV